METTESSGGGGEFSGEGGSGSVRVEDLFDDPRSRAQSGMVFRPVHPGVGFTPGGVSRWMRRRLWVIGVALMVAVLAAMVGFFVVIGSSTTLLWLGYVPVALPVLACVPCFVFLLWVRRAERAAAEGASGYACPNCLYDLSAERVACCSECGQRVVYDALPVLWDNASWRRTLVGRVDEATGFGMAGMSRFEVRWQWWMMVTVPSLPLVLPVVSRLVSKHLIGGGKPRGIGAVSLLAPAIVAAVFIVVFTALVVTTRRRLVRSLRASGGLSCPSCLCDLSGAAVERCPECVQRVDYATLGRSWKPRMKFYRVETAGSET